MPFDVATVMFWILFLALFPISFIWLRRAWRIWFKKDYSEVALSWGVPPPNPERYAVISALVNLAGALSLIVVILSVVLFIAFGVVLIDPNFQSWIAVAGSTLWLKIIMEFVISRQAKMFAKRQKK